MPKYKMMQTNGQTNWKEYRPREKYSEQGTSSLFTKSLLVAVPHKCTSFMKQKSKFETGGAEQN